MSARDDLFPFVGGEEEDLPTFSAAIDRYRQEVLADAIAAVRSEYLTDNTGSPGDLSYNEAITYAIDAIRALQDAARRTGDPLVIRWDRTVIHPEADPTDDTIVCCLTHDGQPVALFLDDEHREALGLMLVDPTGEGDT